MAEVAKPHRRAKLVHLRIGPDGLHTLRPVDAEILQIPDALAHLRIMENHSAALDGMEHFRCMEAQA